MPCNGLRSSWLIVETKSDLDRVFAEASNRKISAMSEFPKAVKELTSPVSRVFPVSDTHARHVA